MSIFKKNKGFKFANIFFPYEAENQHVLCVGASRSGKNGPLLEYINEISLRGNKFICHDRKGELTSIFYREGIDYIINLYDKRFEQAGWNLINEIENPYIDIPIISKSLIQDTKDVFWSNAARLVLDGILHTAYEKNEKNNMGIWKLLTCQTKELVCQLKKSKSYAAKSALEILDNGNDQNKMVHSVLSILRSYSGIFEALKDIDGEFTTKQWLRGERGNIFLTNYPKTDYVNRPLLSLFIELAIYEILTRSNTYNQSDYIYLFLSEFNALQKLDAYNTALNEGASKGLCIYTEIQDFGKTEYIYGRQLLKSIQANHGTLIIFRSRGQNSDECSQLFSKVRAKDISQSVNTSNKWSKSKTINVGMKEQTLILSSQISSLKQHEAIVWFPNKNPVKVSWQPDNWKKYKRANDTFIPRTITHDADNVDADVIDETKEAFKIPDYKTILNIVNSIDVTKGYKRIKNNSI